jgi:hypothetical protein
VGTFAGYFDVAGSEKESDVIVACGALSYVDDWTIFDEHRMAAMRAAGVTTFHMKDFAHFKPPFDVGWRGDEQKRADFLGSLIRQTNESVYRLYVSTLVLSDYASVNAEYQMAERLANPYAWVTANCLFNTFDWLFSENGEAADSPSPVLANDGVAFFVEKGDRGQDGLRKLMKLLGWTDEEFDKTVQLISKKIADQDVTPFHVPDFVAYEYRSEHRYFAVNRKLKARPRGALAAVRAELYPRVGIITAETMRQACIDSDVPRRQ